MSTDSKKYHTYGELPKFKGDIQSYPVWRQDMITYLHGHKVGYTISMADKDFENKVQLIGVWLHDDLALDTISYWCCNVTSHLCFTQYTRSSCSFLVL